MAKYRYGFVSNSSSSSFVISVKPKNTDDDMIRMLKNEDIPLTDRMVESLVNMTHLSSGLTSDYYDDDEVYTSSDIVKYIMNQSQLLREYDEDYLDSLTKHYGLNPQHTHYLVTLSDEDGDPVGCALRSECDSFSGKETDEFKTQSTGD